MKRLRVAVIAPPWLPIPPAGYGGIENVLRDLIPELRAQGVKVTLFATADSTIPVDRLLSIYDSGQYEHIHKPLYSAAPIQIAHLLYAINYIRQHPKDFDVIHDHNGFLGALAFAHAVEDLPPVVHTIHGPPFDTDDQPHGSAPSNLVMWKQLAAAKRLFFVSISYAMNLSAPRELKDRLLEPVHNALAANLFPFTAKKQNYYMTLARFHPDKGQALAVKTAETLGLRLKMAGVVGDMKTKRQVLLEIANPLSPYRGLEDFRYFSDHIYPHLLSGRIDYVGDLAGKRKLRFIADAKALLFPINWDEPFGMAAVEALACGTPVVAMARGALPEIIEHGVNGFLATNEKEFIDYTRRIGEIDPAACRASVEKHFSAAVMARHYIDRYETARKSVER